MGTNRTITRAEWQALARMLVRPPSVLPPAGFVHSGSYVVSALASLLRRGRHIEKFLSNITNQTWFDRSELIIIDAASPDGEADVIAKYQREFPSIVYYRTSSRIGIYEAWNLAVGMARGRYLTNTNLDDLRRADSFELQARALDRHSSADVIYQDFYYTFDDTLDFDEVARVGIKSELPDITPHNLLACNPPHNSAPDVAQDLHDRVGLSQRFLQSAGDYEFWLRGILKGVRFLKVEPAHVVYFQNPHGLSTRPDTVGIMEGHNPTRLRATVAVAQITSTEKVAAAVAGDMEPLLAAFADEL